MAARRALSISGFRLSIAAIFCVPLVLSCSFRQPHIHPQFVQTFIDLNRSLEDDAATVVFDPVLQVLAVGRESGRLELWDAKQPSARIVRQAHAARTEFIAFGREDGIVLTNSVFSDALPIDPNHGTRIWDARTGELLHSLKGMWAPGPIAASPIRSLFLIGDSGDLLLYDHTKRSVVGNRLKMEQDAQVTALAADAVSGLIAVGTSRGDLLLMKLNPSSTTPQLQVIKRASPYGQRVRADVHALIFLDDGKRLVSAATTQGEVVEWDTTTLERRRKFPTTLETVNWASHTAGEPWLVLAGTESTRGNIELVDLRGGIAWRYKANTTHPQAVLLPEIRTGLILRSGGVTQIKYLDQKE
jgi:WD40 repeat protein